MLVWDLRLRECHRLDTIYKISLRHECATMQSVEGHVPTYTRNITDIAMERSPAIKEGKVRFPQRLICATAVRKSRVVYSGFSV